MTEIVKRASAVLSDTLGRFWSNTTSVPEFVAAIKANDLSTVARFLNQLQNDSLREKHMSQCQLAADMCSHSAHVNINSLLMFWPHRCVSVSCLSI
jgi:hypothetical protein